MIAGDLRDVVDRAEDREAVHDLEPRWGDLDEAAHSVAHPRAAHERASERTRLIVRAGDQGHLARHGMRVERVPEPAGDEPSGDDGDQAEAQQPDDEAARDLDRTDE